MVALASNVALVSGKQLTSSGGPGTCPTNPAGKKGISESRPLISPHLLLLLLSRAALAPQQQRTISTETEIFIGVTCVKEYHQLKKPPAVAVSDMTAGFAGPILRFNNRCFEFKKKNEKIAVGSVTTQAIWGSDCTEQTGCNKGKRYHNHREIHAFEPSLFP